MRSNGLAVVVGLVIQATALAQGQPSAAPPAAPAAVPLDPARNRLDHLLMQWEASMKNVQTLAAQCNRIDMDKTFNKAKMHTGIAKFMKPNFAMLHMVQKNGRPDEYEKWVCTGQFLYREVPQSKKLEIFEMPPPKPGQVADDNLLAFLFGMKAEEAKRRYDLRLGQQGQPAEDKDYYYVFIYPRSAADLADFKRARLVLNKTTFMPRQLWFEEANGNEITWDITRIEGNSPHVSRADFYPLKAQQGWKEEQIRRPAPSANRAAEPQPRVARPAN